MVEVILPALVDVGLFYIIPPIVGLGLTQDVLLKTAGVHLVLNLLASQELIASITSDTKVIDFIRSTQIEKFIEVGLLDAWMLFLGVPFREILLLTFIHFGTHFIESLV